MSDDTPAVPEPVPVARPFDQAAIDAGIDAALARVPNARGAVVAVHYSGGVYRLAVAAKINDAWSFAGYLDKGTAGNDGGGAEIRFAW